MHDISRLSRNFAVVDRRNHRPDYSHDRDMQRRRDPGRHDVGKESGERAVALTKNRQGSCVLEAWPEFPDARYMRQQHERRHIIKRV